MNIIEQYKRLHLCGMFGGGSLGPHLSDIERLCKETESKTVLDYGCGKAKFYQGGIHNIWKVTPTLYDPAWPKYEKKPVGQFDGVICTDVLEHVEDPEAVIAELIGYATKFLFCSISCRPSGPKKRLADGRGLHISLYPPKWWKERIQAPHLMVELRFDEAD